MCERKTNEDREKVERERRKRSERERDRVRRILGMVELKLIYKVVKYMYAIYSML